MSQRKPASRDKQSEFASDLAEQFDTRLLSNAVYDDVAMDSPLTALCDAAAQTAEARHERTDSLGDDAPLVEAVTHCRRTLADVAHARAYEIAAEVCDDVLENGEAWTDGWSVDEITAAREEARRWVQMNLVAAERAGVLESIRRGGSA